MWVKPRGKRRPGRLITQPGPGITGPGCTCAWLTLLLVLPAQAQQPESAENDPQHKPLAVKQIIIRDRVIRLEDRMYRLIEKLKDTEPDQAQRLELALQNMGDLGIKWDLERIVTDLDHDALNEATSSQQALIADLEEILGGLVAADDDEAARREELKRLEQLSRELDQLISAESRLRDESAEHSKTEREADPQAQAAIEALRTAQQELRQQTAATQNQQPNAQSAEALAQQQDQLAKQAEQLAQMLEQQQESDSQESAQAAERSMQAATDELQQNSLITAGDEQEDAIRELERALAELSKELPEEDSLNLKELSKEQEQVSQQTGELADQMRSETREGQTTPGQANVEQARDYMDEARQRLDQKRPNNATTEQNKAINELQRAKQQVQQRIQELQEQLREQKLAQLRELLSDLLSEQQAVNRATVALAQIESRDWTRTQQLEAAEQSGAQRNLAGQADQALAILQEDGSTTIFPQLLVEVREDMLIVGTRLGDFKVGAATQQMQADIVEMIQDLLEGIEQTQAHGQPGSQNSQAGTSGEPPLLPTSAELKLLAKLQERIFDRTRQHFVTNGEDLPYVRRLAKKQKDVADMAQEMIRKQQSQHSLEQGDDNIDRNDL